MFNVGDKIKRINSDWGSTQKGGVYTVTRASVGVLRLAECPSDFNYSFDNFQLASDRRVAGRKDDSGKLDMTLLDDMPLALKAIVEVMQWAITKKQPVPYERGSWLGVECDRYRAAMTRHDVDACVQASLNSGTARHQLDPETNLLHLAHRACSSMMALELALRELKATNV